MSDTVRDWFVAAIILAVAYVVGILVERHLMHRFDRMLNQCIPDHDEDLPVSVWKKESSIVKAKNGVIQ